MSELKLEAAREALVERIKACHLRGSQSNQVTIVFDSKSGGGRFEADAGIEIIFTDGASADDFIKDFVELSGHPKNIVVVTDDRDIRYYVRSLGAQILGTKDFLNRSLNPRTSGRSGAVARDQKNIPKNIEGQITEDLAKIWLKGPHKKK